MDAVDYEKLGVFYLGRLSGEAGEVGEAVAESALPFLYESKHLLTHALCVGMTGSGKTGLCVSLLEEAAIDGVPALIIDPKGDLSNLLLTFPKLEASDFAPYLEEEEARRKGKTVAALAEDVAAGWRDGLAAWGQDGARIQKLRDASDVVVYTPGSSAGIQLSLLGALVPPPANVLEDAEAFAGLVEGAASSLLTLAGAPSELRGREHVFVSQLVATAFTEGRELDLPRLIQAVQKPPFARVGALDLETFFPAKARSELATQLNALVASPAAAMWARGEPLDVGRMLTGEGGKARLAIVSLAHLSDEQRMFFVTRLLGAVIAWMRQRSGTTSLRAILYMDEIFGYFPPTAAPPSKRPMLTLLKQARAFGLGVVLATQNPVDLDYKGLGNCGTWFLGRLQTERDKLRILDGLESALSGSGHALDRAALDSALSSLKSRTFLCHDVHAAGPVVFASRHSLSYLRGPLAREQLTALMSARRAGGEAEAHQPLATNDAGGFVKDRPAVASDVAEAFFSPRVTTEGVVYRPGVLAVAKLHYVHAKSKLDEWRTLALVAPFVDGLPRWEHATSLTLPFVAAAGGEPVTGARFEVPPLVNGKLAAAWQKQLSAHAFQERGLTLFECEALGEWSRAGESLAEFQARLAHAHREARDVAMAKLDGKYKPKFERLAEKIRAADAKVQKERADVQGQTVNTAVAIGSGVLGAVFGRGVLTGANVSRAGSAVRNAQRMTKERDDVLRAEETAEELRAKWTELQGEANGELALLREGAGSLPSIVETRVAPRKGDIAVDRFALAWVPFAPGEAGLVPVW